MAAVKLLLLTAIVAVMAASTSAGLLSALVPRVVTEFYETAPTEEGYHFKLSEPNGSSREEMAIIMNPGTDKEELVVMGTYSTYDEKSGIETTTMYTADKDGYKPRYMIKNRKLSPGALKSAAG